MSVALVQTLVLATGVAKAVGNQIVPAATITLEVFLAALISEISSDLVTWFFGIPGSSLRVLVGRLDQQSALDHSGIRLGAASIYRGLLNVPQVAIWMHATNAI